MAALGQGLERAGMRLPASVTPDFPFYGNRLETLIAEVNAPLGLNIDARAPDAVIDVDHGELRLSVLQEFAASAVAKSSSSATLTPPDEDRVVHSDGVS